MYKEIFQDKKAALFDLDGTIIDSLPYWKRALRLVLEDVSDGTAPLYGVGTGTYLGDIWKNTIKMSGLETELTVEELVKKTQQEYLNLFNENPLEPRDGFWNIIDILKNDKGWALALISNSDRSVVEPVLKSLNNHRR
jgi:beta-phosphoglucomutase-like phosphatase (HAD superfamily)